MSEDVRSNLNIRRLDVDEEKITNRKSEYDSNPKTKKTHNGAYYTHLHSFIKSQTIFQQICELKEDPEMEKGLLFK